MFAITETTRILMDRFVWPKDPDNIDKLTTPHWWVIQLVYGETSPESHPTEFDLDTKALTSVAKDELLALNEIDGVWDGVVLGELSYRIEAELGAMREAQAQAAREAENAQQED